MIPGGVTTSIDVVYQLAAETTEQLTQQTLETTQKQCTISSACDLAATVKVVDTAQ